MKRLIILLAVVFYGMNAIAQTDSSKQESKAKKPDTIRIGNIVIIKKGSIKSSKKDSNAIYVNTAPKKQSRLTTNWGILDLGFCNYDDQTNYAAATADGYLRDDNPGYPAIGKDDFKLRTGKSVNVNIWFFMQQLYVVKRNVSLKYGFGLELNNYRYKSNISYRENGALPYTNGTLTNRAFIFRDSISFSKNKLATDYFTIPLMINFASNNWGVNKNHRGFNIAFGISAGYLYSSRNKQVSEARGKHTNRGEYDLEKFKFSYIGEIGFGPIKFYASYAPKSIYEHSMDIRPYNFGLRFSN